MKTIILFFSFAFLGTSFAYDYDEGKSTEWDDYFMPGAGYKMFFPKNKDFGIYHGAVAEFILYARAKKIGSRRDGPTRIKTYANFSILNSTNSEVKDLFYSNLGLNLSFESETNRNFLIPEFGIEIGGMYQRDFSSFHFTPQVGIQLVSTEKLVWSAQGGYQYTTKQFDEYSGFTTSSTLCVLLWH